MISILLCIGGTLILLVVQRITSYEFQAESVVPGILSFVSFKTGHDYCFWIISNYFYFPLDKDNSNDEGQRLTWCQRHLKINLSSIFILAMLLFNLGLPILFITDDLFIQGFSATSCSDATEKYDCFIYETRSYINCSANETFVGDLKCYQFITFAETYTRDFLGSLIRALFLFLAVEKFVSLIFTALKTQLQFFRSRLWIVCAIILGMLMICFSISCIAIYVAYRDSGFTFLSVVEFTVFSLDVLCIGLLLLLGSPMELLSKKKSKNIELKTLFPSKAQNNIIEDPMKKQMLIKCN